MRRILGSLVIVAMLLGLSACKRPPMPSMTGINKFQDITQVRKGMSPNEVTRIMGGRYKTIYEEGILGIDGGNYIWEYPAGRVYFSLDGVTRVIPIE